jgi:tetratricopeptide (TPR) repeat protein
MLGTGLVEIGEYEEALEVCRRGIELARTAQNVFLLWLNLDVLARAYQALLDLEEARRLYEETLGLGGALGPQYEVFSSIRLSAVAALAENWEEAYAHAKEAHEGRISLDLLDSFYLYHEVEALLRGEDGRSAREGVNRLAGRAEINERERIAYLRSLAVLDEWEGDTESALGRLRKAEALAEEIGLPGELWQIRSRIGELHERRGEAGEAHRAFSRAAQILKDLAARIEEAGLREGFLAAPRVRRVLEHH